MLKHGLVSARDLFPRPNRISGSTHDLLSHVVGHLRAITQMQVVEPIF